jgi:hypothetical protein
VLPNHSALLGAGSTSNNSISIYMYIYKLE